MRYLILSDIHANWEALDASLESVRDAYDQIVCLGDVVGYGADPNPVCDWVRDNCAQVIRGNHDKACSGLEEPVLFNPVARAAVEWTLNELTDENRDWLHSLPMGPLELDDFAMVHGSITDEDEYLVDAADAAPQFQHAPRDIVFFGHTHIQGGFFLRALTSEKPPPPAGTQTIEVRPGDVCLINPGSVGQPRDMLWECGFALYDSETHVVEFVRRPYDVEGAQRKIRDAGLPHALADRLAFGR